MREPGGSRTIEAQVDKVKPEVTTDEVAGEYPTYLVVDRSNFQLRLCENLKLAKTYTVAIGAAGFDTPVGVYNIQNKAGRPRLERPRLRLGGRPRRHSRPRRLPENPLKARWMGIYNGAGIHGTDDSARSAAPPPTAACGWPCPT